MLILVVTTSSDNLQLSFIRCNNKGFLLMKKKVKTLSEMDNNSEFNVHTGIFVDEKKSKNIIRNG